MIDEVNLGQLYSYYDLSNVERVRDGGCRGTHRCRTAVAARWVFGREGPRGRVLGVLGERYVRCPSERDWCSAIEVCIGQSQMKWANLGARRGATWRLGVQMRTQRNRWPDG